MCALYWRVVVRAACVLILLSFGCISSSNINIHSSKIELKRCENDWNCTYIRDEIHTTVNTGGLGEDKKWCPIGFQIANLQNAPICYTIKGPGHFTSLYKDCTKNMFTSKLYSQLDINKSIAVWSEYEPFQNTRYKNFTDPISPLKYKETYQNQSVELEDDLCIVIDPVQSYMAVSCDEKHYRYCIVEPMAVDDDDAVKNKCSDLEGALSFSSPVPICLTVLNLGINGPVMYETPKLEEICEEKAGLSLLNEGWVYANHPRFGHKNYPMKSDYLYDALKVRPDLTRPQYTYLIYNETRLKHSGSYFAEVICERAMRSVKGVLIEMIRPNMKAKFLRSRNNVTLLQRRPLYYCDEIQTEYGLTISRKQMNETVTLGCETYTCAGNLNESVQWKKDIRKDCEERVIVDLERLVKESAGEDNITAVFHEVNGVLEMTTKLKNPERLLHLLDQLGSSMKLNVTQRAAKIVETSIALMAADVDSSRPIWGFKAEVRNSSHLTAESVELLTKIPDPSTFYSDINEVVVVLPASVVKSKGRIGFVMFRNGIAFPSSPGHQHVIINSYVIGVTVQNFTQFGKREVIDIHFKPIRKNIRRNESRMCAYWHFTGDDETTGYWSQDGCTFIRATRPGMLDTCRCSHLTHFAEILVPRTVFSEINEIVLVIISIAGCCLSILGLTMVAVTAKLFATWRREFRNKIWLQLCLSILFRSICFLVIVFASFPHYTIGCMLVGIALHYSVLCSFCWMLVAAVLSYRKLVLVFTREPTRKLLKACTFSYGAPCVVIGILLFVASDAYVGNVEVTNPSSAFCYPSGQSLWLTVYAPVAAILFVNMVLFALIFRSVFLSKRVQRYARDSKEALRCISVSCLLTFAFGLNWVAGLFSRNIVAAYIFSITASFQGLIISMFLILGNSETRRMWRNKIKCTQRHSVAYLTTTNDNSNVFIIQDRNN